VTPTVLRRGPYRFFFFSSDKNEPPHVHVERETKRAKFWLEPIALESSNGFAAQELARIAGIIEDHRDDFMRAWNEFFSS
jgi:hypothetical protein